MRVPFAPPQEFLHPVQSGSHLAHHHQGAPGALGAHPGVFSLQMMSQLQHQYSGLVAPVAQMPKGADRAPLGVRLADEGSPSAVSPPGGACLPVGGLDDRKLPRPIGTERAQKKGGTCSLPGHLVLLQQCRSTPHATGPQGDGLTLLQHNRFAAAAAAAEPVPEQQALEQHSYHHQPQQATLNAGGLGGCPPFLNGFPGGATGAMLGGAAQLFSSARVAAEAPHQPQDATPWSPHKLMSGAPGDSLHHHAGHHPPPPTAAATSPCPRGHCQVALAKLDAPPDVIWSRGPFHK
ncbi:hypothetical protein MTO96_006306 [Rhipicephalus appendiculatus]